MSWTDERVELLTKLWNDGLTASQIAKELGEVTRNAVIGKVHRLGLSGRTKSTRKPVKRTVKPKTETVISSISGKGGGGPSGSRPSTVTIGNTVMKVNAVAEQVVDVDKELFIPLHQRASILQLNEHRCKWPIGDPTSEDFYFCGRQKDPSKSYCDHHCGVAYQTSDRRR